MRRQRYQTGCGDCAGCEGDALVFLMLAVIFLYVAIGLFVRRLGASEYAAVALLAGMMTTIYVLFANRVM